MDVGTGNAMWDSLVIFPIPNIAPHYVTGATGYTEWDSRIHQHFTNLYCYY